MLFWELELAVVLALEVEELEDSITAGMVGKYAVPVGAGVVVVADLLLAVDEAAELGVEVEAEAVEPLDPASGTDDVAELEASIPALPAMLDPVESSWLDLAVDDAELCLDPVPASVLLPDVDVDT